jgi:hypothetical protein
MAPSLVTVVILSAFVLALVAQQLFQPRVDLEEEGLARRTPRRFGEVESLVRARSRGEESWRPPDVSTWSPQTMANVQELSSSGP